MDLPFGLGTGFPERVEETQAVGVVAEDGFAPVTAVHDMVNRTFVLDAQGTRHGSRLPDCWKLCQ
jgi:hypothetical protein